LLPITNSIVGGGAKLKIPEKIQPVPVFTALEVTDPQPTYRYESEQAPKPVQIVNTLNTPVSGRRP
jgi:hypothetical protein